MVHDAGKLVEKIDITGKSMEVFNKLIEDMDEKYEWMSYATKSENVQIGTEPIYEDVWVED